MFLDTHEENNNFVNVRNSLLLICKYFLRRFVVKRLLLFAILNK